jgi:hypothetical protein
MEWAGQRGRKGEENMIKIRKEEKSIKPKSGEQEKKLGQGRDKQIRISANGNRR